MNQLCLLSMNKKRLLTALSAQRLGASVAIFLMDKNTAGGVENLLAQGKTPPLESPVRLHS